MAGEPLHCSPIWYRQLGEQGTQVRHGAATVIRNDTPGWWRAAIARQPGRQALLKGGEGVALPEHAKGDTVAPLLGLPYELRHLAQGRRLVGTRREDGIILVLPQLIHARLAPCPVLAGEPVLGMQIVIRGTGL